MSLHYSVKFYRKYVESFQFVLCTLAGAYNIKWIKISSSFTCVLFLLCLGSFNLKFSKPLNEKPQIYDSFKPCQAAAPSHWSRISISVLILRGRACRAEKPMYSLGNWQRAPAAHASVSFKRGTTFIAWSS